jgi:hypothetical protein
VETIEAGNKRVNATKEWCASKGNVAIIRLIAFDIDAS